MLRWWLLIVGLLAAAPAAAHDFWIQPKSFWVAPRASTALAILVGHGPDRQRWSVRLNRVTALRSLGPGAQVVDHQRALRQGTYAPDPALSFATPGVHVVSFQTNHAQNTLPAARFNDYLREEGLTPALSLRQRTGTADEPGREIYSRRAKALVQVGPPGGPAQPQATAPVGLTLEIVPEVDPYSPGRARSLPVRVIFEGRALPGALVKLTNLQADERPVETHLTDRGGRAVFRLPRSGEWQLNVVWTKPLRGDPSADFDTTFSSLTFGFPSAAPGA